MTAREMKDSGVEWIGTIPSCWEVHRIKTNFDIIGGNGFSPSLQGQETGDLPVCKASDISNAGAKLSKAENFITFSEAKLYSFNLIPKGSVLFAKIGEAMKKNNRTLTLVECCADNNCQAMVPKKIDSQFSYYLFNCIDMTWFDNAGTVPCISNQKLKNSKIPYPSIFEQKRIAKYLNNKCAEIDSLTADIEKQIETLQEFKKSQITEEMNNSGGTCVEVPLWSICQCNLESLAENTKEDLEFDYVDISSVSYGKGITKTEHFTFKDAPSRARRKAQVGDVLISTVRTYLRAIVRVDQEHADCIFSTGFSILKPKPHVNSDYLAFLLQTENFIYSVISHSKGVSYPAINSSELMHLKVRYCKSMETQKNVARNLLRKCKQIDAIIKEKQKQLEILSQYKQSLIYEVVTGKKEIE